MYREAWCTAVHGVAKNWHDWTTELDWTERSLQENWRYQGNILCKDGTIKGRNGVDLTEAEDIKKRWQEYTEQLYKKDLHEPDNHNGVITH